ncbi:MAG: hypothetical protein IJ247_01060 [Bacilli bacterium]|nr:hypothetical protein [Bacilli bacterium]
MRSKLLLPFLSACFSFASLSSCSADIYKYTEIEFVDNIAIAFLGEEYDFEPCFEKEEGYSYQMKAYYDNYGIDIPVQMTGEFTFIQSIYSDVFVEISATKGAETIVGTKIVPVAAKPEAIDQWMYNIFPMEEYYIEKSLNYDRTYIKGDDSRSSLKITFSGATDRFNNNAPCSFLNLIDYSNNERFSLRRNDLDGWDNAVFTLDVYNPNQEAITIVPVINYKKECHEGLEQSIYYNFWNAQDDMRIHVASESWVHFDLSLRMLGINENFVFNPRDSWAGSDNFYLQVVNDGKKRGDNPENYEFSFYIDNIDIVKYSKERFPDLDTEEKKEYLDGFTTDENITAQIAGSKYQKNELFSREKVAESTSAYSIKLPLTSVDESPSGMLKSFISGSHIGWHILDLSNAKINFKVYFDNCDRHLMLAFDSDYNVFTNYYNFYINDAPLTEGVGWKAERMDNGWYDISIDCSTIENLFTFLVPATFIRTMNLYVFNNEADPTKESNAYFDSLMLSDYGYTPFPLADTDKPYDDTVSPYAIERPNEDYPSHPTDYSLYLNDWTNVPSYQKGDHDAYDRSTEVVSDHSFSSLHLSNHSGSWRFSFIMVAEWNHWEGIDLSDKDIVFDVKTENYVASNNIGIYPYNTITDDPHTDAEAGAVYFMPTGEVFGAGYSTESLDNEWVRVRVNPIRWASNSDKVFKLGFGTCSKDSPDLNNCEIYIDNLHFEDCLNEGNDLINTKISNAGAQSSYTPIGYDYDEICGDNSVRSAFLTISKDHPETGDPFGIIDIQIATIDVDATGYDLSHKVLHFDYKEVNCRHSFFEINFQYIDGSSYVLNNPAIYPKCGEEVSGSGFAITKSAGEGWFHVSIDMDNSVFADHASKIFKIRIAPRSDTVGEEDAYFYVDNMEAR